MPLFRYFVVVGACLAAVMLALNAMLPQSVASNLATAETGAAVFDRTAIRITGTQTPMKPVIIDTNLPTIVPAAAVTVQADATPRDSSTNGREAYAEVPKIEPANVEPVAKPKKKKVAHRRVHDPMMPGFNEAQARISTAPHMAGWFNVW